MLVWKFRPGFTAFSFKNFRGHSNKARFRNFLVSEEKQSNWRYSFKLNIISKFVEIYFTITWSRKKLVNRADQGVSDSDPLAAYRRFDFLKETWKNGTCIRSAHLWIYKYLLTRGSTFNHIRWFILRQSKFNRCFQIKISRFLLRLSYHSIIIFFHKYVFDRIALNVRNCSFSARNIIVKFK